MKSYADIVLAPINSFDKKFICIQEISGTIYVGSSEGSWVQTMNNPESLCDYFIYDEYHSKAYDTISKRLKKMYGWTETSSRYPINDSHVKEFLKEKYSKVRHQKISSKQKTQTALQTEQKLGTSTTAQENNTNYKVIFRKLDTIYKDNDKIYVVLDYWGTKAIGIANNHCSSMGKRTFWTDEYRNRYKKHFKDKGYKIKGGVAEFLCSKTKLTRATNNSLTPGFKVTEVSDEQPNNQTTSSSQQVDINFNISEKRQQCEAIGFTPNSEKFADCVLRLVELDMKNQQSNNMMTSQKKSQSDQFMSNALINLGQQLMQPNSRVNNSRTRNCSVRKSFGNTSTVTCY